MKSDRENGEAQSPRAIRTESANAEMSVLDNIACNKMLQCAVPPMSERVPLDALSPLCTEYKPSVEVVVASQHPHQHDVSRSDGRVRGTFEAKS